MPATDAPAPPDAESVSPEDVRRLAGLARLDFTDQEIDALAGDLSRLLSHARQLGEVDTAGVEPMPPGAPAVPQRTRQDKPQKPLAQEEALENAPEADERFFRVPGALK